MVYGLGGIGMRTMAGNALLMKALMSLRQKVSTDAMNNQEFRESLRSSNFGNDILHWNKPNPFTQNYAQFIDHIDNPKFLAKRFENAYWKYKIAKKLLHLKTKFHLRG